MAVSNRKKALFFGAACLLQFVSNFVSSLQGVLLSDYIEYYHLESASQGLMSTFQFAGCTLMCIITLIIAGRIPRHRLLIFSGLMCSIPMFLIGLKPSFPIVLLMYACVGMGFATNSNVVSSVSTSLYPGNTLTMGIVHAFFGAGGIICPIFMRAILNDFPWNIVCMFNAFISFMLFVLYLCVLPMCKDVISELNTDSEPVHLSDLGRNFRKIKNVMLLVAVFGYQAYQNGIGVWISRYSDNYTSPAGLGAVTLSSFWFGNLIARLTVTRLKVRTEILFGLGMIGGIIALLVGVFSGSSTVLLICTIIAGLTTGASTPFGYFLSSEWFEGNKLLPPAICGMTMFISVSVTSPITAAIADSGLRNGMVAIAVYGVISLCAIIIILLSSKSKR